MTNAEHLHFCRVPGRTDFITSQKACILFFLVIRTTVIVIDMSIVSFVIIC